ncbi:MAG: PHB depolymerase family esterase [Myxococcota bacterium]
MTVRGWFVVAAMFVALACGWPASGEPTRTDGPAAEAPAPSAPAGRRGGGGARTGDWVREIRLQSGGIERTALLHVPSGATEGQKLPLVVLFHGGQGKRGDDAYKMASRWDHLRDQGFVMVFPNGIGTGERAWAGPDDKRDLDFTRDLIAEVDRQVGIDRDRVYAAGFSNGSGMVWMLECFEADRFAGFGHVQQSMAKEVRQKCKPDKHVPTIWFHGDADAKAQWDGNAGTLGVPKTMEFELDYQKCDASKAEVTELTDLPGDATQVTRTVYPSCKEVPAIELYRIHGGAHHWPTTERTREAEGKCSDIDASTEMVRFWRAYAGL